MIVLGVSHLKPSGVVHDVTASLMIDGKIISSASEDRFTGIKHHEGYPAASIKFLLQDAGLRLSDVDRVSVGYGLDEDLMDSSRKFQFFSYPKKDSHFRPTQIESKDPVFFDHEYIHAKIGFFFSGFEKALVVSLDGGGVDGGKLVSGGIFVIDKGETEVIEMYPAEASLGWTYGGLTEICGFRMMDGEGKTMSLAAFAERESQTRKDEIYNKIKKTFPMYDGYTFIGNGIDFLTYFRWQVRHNSSSVSINEHHLIDFLANYSPELIAWGSQKVLEESIKEIVTSAVEFTGIKNVVLSGGVFFNMIANMRIKEHLDKMNCSLFINPVCGDMGNALGSSLELNFQETGKYQGYEWPSMSLGPSFDNEKILSAISKYNLKSSRVDQIGTAIDMLEKGKIIGWFQGKAELGPRGLGNRSILSRGDDIKFKDLINNKVKHREPWRPFCPTIIVEKANEYLENYTYAPYMILGFDMKDSEKMPAVAHVDNTTRPQTLKKEYNKEFYEVIEGVGGLVLNTSLNLAGDPINAFPEDALLTLKNSEMDALIIGDYLVERK